MHVKISTRLAAATVLALGLVGCSGGTGTDVNASGNGTGGVAQADSFFSQVSAIIAATSDATEPSSTDAITATSPEATEPTVLL